MASDPRISCWVSASAGTGKTKVLIDRVMRLLISGVDLAKILCLTFTNAASDEMLNRITNQLKNWACISDTDLIKDVRQLLGRNPSSHELQKARNLCYTYLQLQDNSYIQTIHGFCQRLLQRFPLEANINPYFTILDEFQTKEAINYISCSLASDIQLEASLKFLACHCSEDKIIQLIYDIISHNAKFSALIAKFPDGESYKLHLFDLLNLDEGIKNNIINAFYTKFTDTRIKAYINQIINEGQDNHFILQLLRYQQQEYNEFVNNLPQIISLFITDSGSKRRSLLNKSIKGSYPELNNYVTSLQDQIVQLDNVINCVNIVESTYHFYVISIFVLNKYKNYKLDNNYIDYNDLILNTYNLLQNKACRDWVLYKLSTSIDHILIDEAQDNSAEQWSIVLALLEDILAGNTNKNYSSVFIVGDSKQSIFSFQGANLCIFNYLRKDLQKRFAFANKTFKSINLDTSYRSTQAILDFVQSVLAHINTSMQNLLEPSDLIQLKCSRNTTAGTVQLWDMVYNSANSKSKLQLSFPITPNIEHNIAKTNLLAQQIASYIKQQIVSKRILPSTGQPASYNDFLILVRQRNHFVQQLIYALKSFNLKVAGMDRVLLQEHLSIMDLIALAKFLITPNNDINFASLIKSPIIGGSENDIHFLCTQRPLSTSIWQFLLQMAESDTYYQDISHKLQKFIELYRTTSPHYFFYIVIEVLNYRQILTHINIEDGDDIIDEFLKVVTYFFTHFNPTIGDFITWFERNRIELKRDVATQNSISIMTIHAAKGLQSPVVILPDTTTCPRHSANMLWGDEHNVLWLPQVKYLNNTYLHSCLANNKYKDYQEYLRLFYVAMTRAQDELIICGCKMTNNVSEKCWYSIARESMLKISDIKLVQEKLGTVAINKIIYNK